MRAWNSSSPDCLAAIICRIWPNEVNIESSNSAVDTILISLLLPLLLLPVCEQRFVVNQSALVFCPKQRADLGEGIRPWLAILGRIRWQVNAPDRADRAPEPIKPQRFRFGIAHQTKSFVVSVQIATYNSPLGRAVKLDNHSL